MKKHNLRSKKSTLPIILISLILSLMILSIIVYLHHKNKRSKPNNISKKPVDEKTQILNRQRLFNKFNKNRKKNNSFRNSGNKQKTKPRRRNLEDKKAFDIFVKEQLKKTKKNLLKHIDKVFADGLSKKQVDDIIRAGQEGRRQMLENQFNVYHDVYSHAKALKESGRITRQYSQRILNVLGGDQYFLFTGWEPDEDPWALMMSANPNPDERPKPIENWADQNYDPPKDDNHTDNPPSDENENQPPPK